MQLEPVLEHHFKPQATLLRASDWHKVGSHVVTSWACLTVGIAALFSASCLSHRHHTLALHQVPTAWKTRSSKSPNQSSIRTLPHSNANRRRCQDQNAPGPAAGKYPRPCPCQSELSYGHIPHRVVPLHLLPNWPSSYSALAHTLSPLRRLWGQVIRNRPAKNP